MAKIDRERAYRKTGLAATDDPKPLNVPRVYNLITDPKEEYNMAEEATWVLPVMFNKFVEFQGTLIEEPPIVLGTPDPYEPPE